MSAITASMLRSSMVFWIFWCFTKLWTFLSNVGKWSDAMTQASFKAESMGVEFVMDSFFLQKEKNWGRPVIQTVWYICKKTGIDRGQKAADMNTHHTIPWNSSMYLINNGNLLYRIQCAHCFIAALASMCRQWELHFSEILSILANQDSWYWWSTVRTGNARRRAEI